MSFLTTLRSLPPRTRLTVGLAFLAWGTAGLYLSDSAERSLGFAASEREREALGSLVPRVSVVERREEGDR